MVSLWCLFIRLFVCLSLCHRQLFIYIAQPQLSIVVLRSRLYCHFSISLRVKVQVHSYVTHNVVHRIESHAKFKYRAHLASHYRALIAKSHGKILNMTFERFLCRLEYLDILLHYEFIKKT